MHVACGHSRAAARYLGAHNIKEERNPLISLPSTSPLGYGHSHPYSLTSKIQQQEKKGRVPKAQATLAHHIRR